MVLLEEINDHNRSELRNIEWTNSQEVNRINDLVCSHNVKTKKKTYEFYLIYDDTKPIGLVWLEVDKENESFSILYISVGQIYHQNRYYKETITIATNYLISQGASKVDAYCEQDNYQLEGVFHEVGFRKADIVANNKIHLVYTE